MLNSLCRCDHHSVNYLQTECAAVCVCVCSYVLIMTINLCFCLCVLLIYGSPAGPTLRYCTCNAKTLSTLVWQVSILYCSGEQRRRVLTLKWRHVGRSCFHIVLIDKPAAENTKGTQPFGNSSSAQNSQTFGTSNGGQKTPKTKFRPPKVPG